MDSSDSLSISSDMEGGLGSKRESGVDCIIFVPAHKTSIDVLSFFQKNHLFTSLALLPFAIVVRHIGFIFDIPYPEQIGGGLYHLFEQAALDTWYWQLAATFLVFIHAVMLNRICIINRLGTGISLIPGLIYISLSSFLPSFLYLSPALLAMTFLLAGLTQLFYTYKRHEVSSRIFNSGFWFGTAALCYPSLIIYFLLGYIGLIILRSFKWKERLRYITGFVLPFFLVGVVYFWYDLLPLFGELQFSFGLEMLSFAQNARGPVIVIIAVILLICILILNYNFYTSRKNIKSRKKIDIFYWTILMAGISVLIQQQVGLNHLLLLIPAISYFFSEHLLQSKSRSLAEFLHLLLILMTFFSQYSLFLL